MKRVLWIPCILMGGVASVLAQAPAPAPPAAAAKINPAAPAGQNAPAMVFSGDPREIPIITVEDFRAGWENDRVHLEWTTATEFQSERLFLERSEDNRVFTIISEFAGQGVKASPTVYRFDDGMVRPGALYYYRLVSQNAEGEISVHQTISSSPPIAQPLR